MTRWSWPRTLVAVALAFTVSGCIDLNPDELEDFGTLAAAVWEPGYDWEWTATEDGIFEGSGEEGSHQSAGHSSVKLKQTVLGTAPVVGGATGYVLQREGWLDGGAGLFGGESLALVAPDTLEAVAYAWMGEGCSDPALVRWDEDRYTEGPEPFLDFPLAKGDTWTGEDHDVSWTATVLGRETVDVAAGSFQAVVVHYTAELQEEKPDGIVEDAAYFDEDYYEEEDVEEIHDFRFTMKVWYAEAARNIVQMNMHRAMSMTEGEETYRHEMTTRIELTGFSLTATDGVQYPGFVPRGEVPQVRPPQLSVVADKAFPLNAADNDTTVTFGARGGPAPAEGHIEVVDVIPALDLGDAFENYTLRWTVRSHNSPFYARGYGDTFTVGLPAGGRFTVDASLWYGPAPAPSNHSLVYGHEVIAVPMEAPRAISVPMDGGYCPLPRSYMPYVGYPVASADDIEVFWQKDYSAALEPGLPARVELGRFNASDAWGTAIVETTITSDVPVASDDGVLVLTSPDGTEYTLTNGASAPVDQVGEWIIEWEGQGLMPYVLPATVNVGHTVDVVFAVRY